MLQNVLILLEIVKNATKPQSVVGVYPLIALKVMMAHVR
jgi:hypothetical protein